MSSKESKGYLIVASRRINYYQAGIMLAQSIKDYYPDAKICLVTEERFCDGRESIAEHLIFCGGGRREKLWALSQTPFDITMYLDADMDCVHEDISKAFDELGERDLVFTDLPRKFSWLWNGWSFGKDDEYNLKICGAVVLYDIRKPQVREFLEDWYSLYLAQQEEWWPEKADGTPDYETYPRSFRKWDQFTIWWMTEKSDKYKDLNVGFFKEPLRWNFWLYLECREETQDPVVLKHYSARMKKAEPFEFEDIL